MIEGKGWREFGGVWIGIRGVVLMSNLKILIDVLRGILYVKEVRFFELWEGQGRAIE